MSSGVEFYNFSAAKEKATTPELSVLAIDNLSLVFTSPANDMI